MASTYSTNLKLELIGTGDQSGTWGATTNTNMGTLIEQAIAGYATQAVTDSGVATVLTIPDGASSTGRNYVITLTGALTAARTVEVPAVNKPYIFFNSTTGGFSVTVKVTGQTGVVIANGKKAIVYTNTTDVIEVANAPATEAGTQTLTNKTLTSPLIGTVIGGTTASSSLTLQSTSGVGTSDSILFKVGNNGATTAMTITTAGKVGIGTATPDTTLTSYNTVSDYQFELGYASTYSWKLGRVASTGNLSFTGYNGVATPVVPMTFDLSGNVGIGTASPSGYGKLAVFGGTTANSPILAIVSNAFNSQQGCSLDFVRDGFTQPIQARVSIQDNGATACNLLFSTKVDGTAGVLTERMRIDSSGNVGIGTSSPSSTFKTTISYNDNAFGGGLYVVNTNTGASAIAAIQVRANNAGVSGLQLYQSQNGDGALINFNNSPVIFGTNNAERMRIDSNGNVGIGTANPAGYSAKFATVAASDYSVAAIFISSSSAVNWARTDWDNQNVAYNGIIYQDQSGLFNIRNDGANDIAFSTNGGNERMRIDSSGNVGIGATANASAILDAQSTTKGVRFPNMTTTQKNAVSSPAAGLVVFDTTLAKLCVYSGSAWQTITSI